MTDRDEVLSLEDDESFSGFSSLSEDEPSKVKVKSKVVKKTKDSRPLASNVTKKKVPPQPKRAKTAKNKENVCSENPVLDISKLTREDIDGLRGLLGITQDSNNNVIVDENENEEVDEWFATPLNERPNIHVEVASEDIVVEENANREDFAQGFNSALFEEDVDDGWDLPRLKVPEKGKPVAQSLARMINVACTSQCDVDNLIKNNKVPVNCDMASPPTVNSEVWKVLDKRTQTHDRSLVDVQNLVAASMTPIIKLAEVLKQEIMANSEAKTLLSDCLTLLGQTQYALSVRRRFSIRPALKKKYQSLCNSSMPITNQLFGDDVSKSIKACDSMQFIGNYREQTYRPQVFRGRGFGRFPRRGQSGMGQRYYPYPARGQSRGLRNYQIPRRAPTATVTGPNDRA